MKGVITPLFLGQGETLFQEGVNRKLTPVATKTLGKGVVVLTYQPMKRS